MFNWKLVTVTVSLVVLGISQCEQYQELYFDETSVGVSCEGTFEGTRWLFELTNQGWADEFPTVTIFDNPNWYPEGEPCDVWQETHDLYLVDEIYDSGDQSNIQSWARSDLAIATSGDEQQDNVNTLFQCENEAYLTYRICAQDQYYENELCVTTGFQSDVFDDLRCIPDPPPTPTPTPTPTPAPTPTPTPSPTPDTTPYAPVDVTFVVDTNLMADGVNRLAYVDVAQGERVYMVGNFNGWDPQDQDNALTESSPGSGIFKITLTFPLISQDGSQSVWNPGDTDFEYKFTKTLVNNLDEWSNVIKDFEFTSDLECTDYAWNDPAHQVDNFTGGLWEVPNFLLIIPSQDTELNPVQVEAWRDYAENFGYPSCQ